MGCYIILFLVRVKGEARFPLIKRAINKIAYGLKGHT